MDELNNLEKYLTPSPRMPVLFVGHGNPMHAILENNITEQWQMVGSNLPEAQVIVVISAHWQTRGTHITDAPKQPIIYDMYGFPDELYKVKYDAMGSPEIATILQKQLLKYEAALDSTWGLDHGTWAVLKHLAPKPKVPVLQISLDFGQSLADVVEMFGSLKSLRDKGVIFIGSGNIVHNLREVDWSDSGPQDWAMEFDSLTSDAIQKKDLRSLIHLEKLGHVARLAVPTDEHYRPMLAAMSLLDAGESVRFFNEAIDLGSIGMRSFITDLR